MPAAAGIGIPFFFVHCNAEQGGGKAPAALLCRRRMSEKSRILWLCIEEESVRIDDGIFQTQ